jgi:hypothetical protein
VRRVEGAKASPHARHYRPWLNFYAPEIAVVGNTRPPRTPTQFRKPQAVFITTPFGVAASLAVTKAPPRQLGFAHCSFAYSALACFRMGMSGSASFQTAWTRQFRLRLLSLSSLMRWVTGLATDKPVSLSNRAAERVSLGSDRYQNVASIPEIRYQSPHVLLGPLNRRRNHGISSRAWRESALPCRDEPMSNHTFVTIIYELFTVA